MKGVMEVTNLIKGFTKKSPSDTGDLDPRYREYLAKCSRLLKLDARLMDLNRGSRDEYFFDTLKEIKQEVEKIVTSSI